ncbi:MAG: hypothetical protein ACKON9_30690, partial [Planctomycetaceae bacterium]
RMPGADPETGQPLQSSPSCIWSLLAEQPETLRHDLFRSAESSLPQGQRVLWTDDYSNLLQLIRW